MSNLTYLAPKYLYKYVELALSPSLLASTSRGYHLSTPDSTYMISIYILAIYFACMLKFGFPEGGRFSCMRVKGPKLL